MTWINVVSPQSATGRLHKLYERVTSPDGAVDNILQAHSLRPHTLEGHMALYKNVLHHTANETPKWFLELLGVLTSHLNGCAYCVEHHTAGLARLLADPMRAATLRRAVETEEAGPFTKKERAALAYARKLTLDPAEMVADDVDALRQAGWPDGQVLEINQVVSYFAYANRTVLGLGVSTRGDVLGLSPGGDGWRHD